MNGQNDGMQGPRYWSCGACIFNLEIAGAAGCRSLMAVIGFGDHSGSNGRLFTRWHGR